MRCCHHYEPTDTGESVFAVDVAAIRYGRGVLRELGHDARALGLERVAVFTEPSIRELEPARDGLEALRTAGVDVVIYDAVSVEPTDRSFADATRFATEARVDGFVSIGGGSVIDTCKAANLYSTWPADPLAYVNAPLGEGRAVPGTLRPHIACPTTCGTGSECTGIAVFDLLDQGVKTGIASRWLRPDRALIDPAFTRSLPAAVVAASGFDVLSHALESYTARPFTRRAPVSDPADRPLSQGANPWSDIGCREALRLSGQYLERAVADAGDHEARESMMFAATLAGIAFGNSGVHIPHGMSYSVAGLVRDFQPPGYPTGKPICPHGMSVIVNAPAAFRFTAGTDPGRHREAAALLGAQVGDAAPGEEGEVLAQRIETMMRATGMPNGIAGVGYGESDLPRLAAGANAQQRLLANAPLPVTESDLRALYREALSYW